jgi:hypothetical protein
MPGLRLVSLVLACGLVACGSDDAPGTTEEPIGEGGGTPDDKPPPAPPRSGTTTPPGPAVDCAVGGAVEIEPNDTAQTATSFTELTFCGVLATGTDVDYATFVTPPGTKLTVFQAVIDGKVDFELSLGGAKFGPGEVAKFGSGTYLVKAFTKDGKGASYSYRVQFDPL